MSIYVRLRSTSNPQIYVQFRRTSDSYPFSNSQIGVQFSNLWPFLTISNRRPMTNKRVRVMVFNATFNTISAISWWSDLLVEETGVPGEIHRPVVSHWQTISHNVVSDVEQTWPTSIIWQDKSTYNSSPWKGHRLDSNKSAIDLRIWKRRRFEITFKSDRDLR
jgi:hypothetical protein